MRDDTGHHTRPAERAIARDAELAVWERFLSGTSSVEDDAQIAAWTALLRGSAPLASVREAVRQALSPAGAPPVVDAPAMLARLESRRPSTSGHPRSTPPPQTSIPWIRRVATIAAWATAAAVTVVAAATTGDPATRAVRLGPRDTGTYHAGPTRRLSLRFSDGTRIAVAPNSSLRVSGAGSHRSVYVTGEAYVDAQRDGGVPLVVRADNAVLEDVGARFAVHTDSDRREVRIAVATGVVLAGDSGAPWASGRVLTRGTLGVVSARGTTRTLEPSGPDAALVWERGGPRLGPDQMRDELLRDALPRASWKGA